MATSASAVSARLRRAGWGITPNYSRQGLLVSKSWRRGLVSVMVVRDKDRDADDVADHLADEFATDWPGYTITRTGHSFTIEKKD